MTASLGPGTTVSIRARRLVRLLPRGRVLPEHVWRQRHIGIVVLLWLHAPLLFAIAVLQGNGIVHSTVEASIIAVIAVLAVALDRHQAISTVLASLDLMACSAELVQARRIRAPAAHERHAGSKGDRSSSSTGHRPNRLPSS